MNRETLQEHLRDILEDQRDCHLPFEVALEQYTDSMYNAIQTNNLSTIINTAYPDLREITFHSDGRVIAKSGGRAKNPKKLYTAKTKLGEEVNYGELAIKAINKLVIDNQV